MTDRDALARLIADQLADRSWTGRLSADDPLTQVMVDDMFDLTEIADAILAAGWRAPGCEHVWMAVRLDQTQQCSLCGTVRRHSCTFNCPTPHVRATHDELAALGYALGGTAVRHAGRADCNAGCNCGATLRD